VKKPFPVLAVLTLIAALAIAGCGGSDDNGSSSGAGGAYGGGGGETTKAASSAPSGGGAVTIVSATTVPKLGKVIVDSKGFTLYDFHKDKGGKSSCYGGCAQVWPPLLTEGKAQAGEGAMAAKLGTTKRKDGTVQVTYAGWPLYTYTADTKPGDANGNDISTFGAQWYALLPSGEEAGD
jgi:predicted lipoprotein with Yx(FWY)xxD motif